tara:strand:+ start:1786 stop:2586 length:801 start_codon:yes stop_codon:yes gene_type:complete
MKLPKRHRGKYNPTHPAPYELSRSRIENFVKCEACFYLQQVEGVNFPSIPGFNINEATDVLLKKDFDECREKGISHPFLNRLGKGHLIPYSHENFNLWTQSLHFGAEGRLNTVYEASNLKIGGGLDDVWYNKETKELHVVDYKSTSTKTQGKSVSLSGWWKNAYKRQMDLYVWVLRRLDFEVSNTGYFLYCDADRFTSAPFLREDEALMDFKVSLLDYSVDCSWIEPTLMAIRKLLDSRLGCPKHDEKCEYGKFLRECEASVTRPL